MIKMYSYERQMEISSRKFLIISLVIGFISLSTLRNAKPLSYNFLFAIADDQSFPHAGVYQMNTFSTPAFDSLAWVGVHFTRAFAAAPQCSPSRAAILTGKNIWQLEEAGTHGSYFPSKFQVFTDVLRKNGYHTGYTGKAWDPGNWKEAGWKMNPVGEEYNIKKLNIPVNKDISIIDYVGNLELFLDKKPADAPFFFWFGAHEPHRTYTFGAGQKNAKEKVTLPPFLPQTDTVEQDFLDYAFEINYFDLQLGKMIQLLKERGALERTYIIVTADNGMAFPNAKASLHDFGIHVPLVIAGPDIRQRGRANHSLISLKDIPVTILALAGLEKLPEAIGRSLVPILKSHKKFFDSPVFAGRERHTHARPDNVGYPSRAIRTSQYLYIRNFKPDRWPAGDPPPLSDTSGMIGFEDIDDSPSKRWMIYHAEKFPVLFQAGFGKKGEEELYDIEKDPGCLYDVSAHISYQTIKNKLRNELENTLLLQNDPRMYDNGDIFESYPRFGKMRPFPGFNQQGKYNPDFLHPLKQKD
jgi:uncharacterized sulfatase